MRQSGGQRIPVATLGPEEIAANHRFADGHRRPSGEPRDHAAVAFDQYHPLLPPEAQIAETTETMLGVGEKAVARHLHDQPVDPLAARAIIGDGLWRNVEQLVADLDAAALGQ